eukprot:GHVL01028714.1.p1 GENE.GHVL01028714.1~~GHVL01028714.1.p1  ORF type:complete len:287 (+),score=59.69 GHVL01028714.1:361-1221(+)
MMIFIFLLVGLSVAQQCPKNRTINTLHSDWEGNRAFYFQPDIFLTRISATLGIDKNQASELQAEAEIFFRETFGVDFTTVPLSNGVKFIEGHDGKPGGALFAPVQWSETTYYKGILSTSQEVSPCPTLLKDQAWVVTVMRDGAFNYTGYWKEIAASMGMEDHLISKKTDSFLFGFYVFEDGFSIPGEKEIIFYFSACPTRNPLTEGAGFFMCNTHHLTSDLGWGKADGVTYSKSLGSRRMLVSTRTVMSFADEVPNEHFQPMVTRVRNIMNLNKTSKSVDSQGNVR